MAFMLYENYANNSKNYIRNLDMSYSLAGYNLIYKSWLKSGSPFNQGWSVEKNQLSKLVNDDKNKNYTFVIDFDPSANWRIGLIEIERIHVFTYGDKKGKSVYWSPLMLELSDILYIDLNDDDIDIDEKPKIISEMEYEPSKMNKSIEFLYLNGASWNWGKNGMTNAAFIQSEARAYFKQFF
jgi:hypothetical protein